MLRTIRDGSLKLTWDAHDILRMSKLVGPDLAELQRCGWIPSLAKLAQRAKIKLSSSTLERLNAQNILVGYLREKQQWKDADGRPQLFRHQRADLAYMRDVPLPAYLLAHPPGVGKTPVAICWVDEILNSKRNLVICPNSAKEQWAAEIRRWDARFPNVTIVQGTIPQQLELISTTDHGWVVTHWESLVHARAALLHRGWNTVVADEAQTAANRKAQRTKTLFKLEADYRIALTGHPFANEPTELYSILRFLYPDRYKSYWRFFYMFVDFYAEAFGKLKVTGTKRPNLLKWEIAPFTLRRLDTKRPPITRMRRVSYLTPGHLKEYAKLKKEFFVELKGRDKKLPIINVMARTTRIRQWLVDPSLVGGSRPSVKYPVVHEIMRELDGPPVIFTMFKQAGYKLESYLRHCDSRRTMGMISGDASPKERRRLQQQFLAGGLDALIVVIQAGGVALNLGKYGYVIHLDLPWNGRDFEQTEGRVRRPEEGTGKIVPCTSYRIITANSFEDRVMEPMINSKHGEFGRVFTVDSLEDLLDVA